MALITTPTVLYDYIESAKERLKQTAFTRRSLYTGHISGAVLPGRWWEVDVSLVPLDPTEAADIKAFLVNCDGVANTFQFRLPSAALTNLSGYVGAAGVVNGADQEGITLVTDGWDNSVTVRKAGELITFNDELKLLTLDAVSDGSGNCTFTFKPPIRNSPTNNGAIELANPYLLARMVEDDSASWDVSAPWEHGFGFKIWEDIV